MNALVLDCIVAGVILTYASVGYRRGLFATVAMTIGFLAGAGLALWYVPTRIDLVIPARFGALRPFAVVLIVLLVGTIGQIVATTLTRRVHAGLSRSRARGGNAVLGALVTSVVAALVCWFVAGMLRTVAPAQLGKAVSGSYVLSAIDKLVPSSSERLLARALLALDDYGFPRVFGGMASEPITPVDAADSSLVQANGVKAAQSSVLRIDAVALNCGGRMSEGSGWVASPHLVVTNAHVVAGAEQVRVRVGSSRLSARIVAFDPERDLAVLSVPGLQAPTLARGSDLEQGDGAVVAGYPYAGPYHVDAARVRGILTARGDDIYGENSVVREIYSLRASINPGNSGGPLLDASGRVVGVVFARSLDDVATAYALTLDELDPVLGSVTKDSRPVGTGGCVVG